MGRLSSCQMLALLDIDKQDTASKVTWLEGLVTVFTLITANRVRKYIGVSTAQKQPNLIF